LKYKTGFAAIIGRPNSGKSTLLNSLIGEKVSIISPKPQTTRNVLRGIYTDDQSQVIFVDTPGIYKAVNKLGEIMVKNAEETFGSTDVIIYIADASRKDLPGGEEHITSLLKNTKKPVILALNKIDKLSSKAVILKIIDELSKKVDFTEVIPVSALNNDGTDLILDSVKRLLPA
jgi:GTP-binding protein Era